MAGLVVPVFFLVLAVWSVVGAAAAVVCTTAARRQARVRRAVEWLDASFGSASDDEVRRSLDDLLQRIPTRCLIAHLSERSIPEASGRALSSWLVTRSHAQLVAYARCTARRATRRRVDALRVLARGGLDALPFLQQALADGDVQVVAAAVSLLGSMPDRRAAGALIEALRLGRYQPSRIATVLDRFPLPISDLLRPLASDASPIARFWGATLLSRYGGTEGVADEVARLVRDPDPQVRKAAIETLGSVKSPMAAMLALALLGDPVWYVRAHAARTLGELGRSDLATHVMALLSDRQWWVRQAAKESLEKMGPAVWRDVIKGLDHTDLFARNGAAEVLQNLGVLDSMIVLEATAPHPAPDKIAMLRKIAAAGGVRMTNALLDRTDARLAERIRTLLDTIGLEAAGV